MEWIETASRILHILAGTTSLVTGLLALGFFKIIKTHRAVGKVFFYSMTVVFVTAVHLATVKGIDFLFCIAVLSYFSTFHGIRSLQFWKGKRPDALDSLAAYLCVAAGLFIVGKSIYLFNGAISGLMILYAVFGLLNIGLAYGAIVRTRTLSAGSIDWFTSHRSNMGGALIATITAFSTTALNFLPEIVAWLWPTIILPPLLTVLIRKTNKMYGIG